MYTYISAKISNITHFFHFLFVGVTDFVMLSAQSKYTPKTMDNLYEYLGVVIAVWFRQHRFSRQKCSDNIVSNWTKDNNNGNYIRNLKRNATTLTINNNLEMIQYKTELMNGNFWGRIFGCFRLNCLVYTFPCR